MRSRPCEGAEGTRQLLGLPRYTCSRTGLRGSAAQGHWRPHHVVKGLKERMLLPEQGLAGLPYRIPVPYRLPVPYRPYLNRA